MAENNKVDWKSKERGAIWVKKSRSGEEYMTGYVSNSKGQKMEVVLYKNRFLAESPNGPTWRVYESEKREVLNTPAQNKPTPKKVTPAVTENPDDTF